MTKKLKNGGLSARNIRDLRSAHKIQLRELATDPATVAEFQRLGPEMFDSHVADVGYVGLGYDGRVVAYGILLGRFDGADLKWVSASDDKGVAGDEDAG